MRTYRFKIVEPVNYDVKVLVCYRYTWEGFERVPGPVVKVTTEVLTHDGWVEVGEGVTNVALEQLPSVDGMTLWDREKTGKMLDEYEKHIRKMITVVTGDECG